MPAPELDRLDNIMTYFGRFLIKFNRIQACNNFTKDIQKFFFQLTFTSNCSSELLWTDITSTERCQPISCPALSNNETCSNHFDFMSNCSLPCPDGPENTKRTGQVVRTCQADKTWSDPVEECEYITCPTDDGQLVSQVNCKSHGEGAFTAFPMVITW